MTDHTELLKELDVFPGECDCTLGHKAAKAIRALKQALSLQTIAADDAIHAAIAETELIETLEEQVKEYDKALQYIADNENFNHWTSMTEGGYAFKERKRIKAMGEQND